MEFWGSVFLGKLLYTKGRSLFVVVAFRSLSFCFYFYNQFIIFFLFIFISFLFSYLLKLIIKIVISSLSWFFANNFSSSWNCFFFSVFPVFNYNKFLIFFFLKKSAIFGFFLLNPCFCYLHMCWFMFSSLLYFNVFFLINVKRF